MEAGHARGNRDNPRLPTLSLGLSSVRLIVNKIEAEYARAVAPDAHGRELVKYDPNIDDDDYYDPPLDASRAGVLNRFVANLALALRKCIPSVSFGNFAVLAVTAGFVAPKMFSYLLIYPFCRLVFGTLYPAYASYKAVRTKNLKEYVKWMMYWIVFALFTCTETFTDVFLSWFPFYYEVKIVLVLWLLSPATKGSSILYRKFVHPALCRREQEIDEYIAKAKDQGYHTVLNLGTKGVNYATTVIMQTAIKGGGGLVQQLRKSYSLSDLSECDARDETRHDEADDVLPEPRLIRRTAKTAYNTRRSASESNNRGMYFPEVDVDVRAARRTDEPDLSHIKSSDDISSGYSSADNSASLSRAGSLSRRPRPRTAVTTIKRPAAAEDNEVIIEELHDDDTFDYANMPPLLNLSPSPLFISQSDPPFLYQYVGDQIKIIQILGDQVPNNSKPNFMQRDQTETVTKDNLIKKQDLNKSDKVNQDQQQDSAVNEYSDTEQILKSESMNIASTSIDENTFENAIDVINDQDNVNMSIPDDKNGENDSKTKNNSEIDTTNTVDVSSVHDTNVQARAEKSKEEAEIATDTDDRQDCASLEMSPNENDSADSDDEASFGTPDNSPKSKRKSPKGRYGKGKAPPPPKIENIEVKETKENTSTISDAVSTTSQESLVDIVNRMPNETIRESGNFKGLHVVNPIAEKKRRHKSKSPAKIPKGSTSGIGKLLQIPGKLAFWNKSDDKSKESVSSSDNSRRSSTAEKPIEDFQSCLNVDMGTDDVKVNEDNFTFRDANDFDTESVSQEIIDKSNALLKVIEEKLETHPEYKFVSLHEEIPTASKSTDV